MSTPQHPDPNRFFRVDHLRDNLRARSVRGGTITGGGQVVKFILRLGSSAILARLLTPEDYGLVIMVLAVIGFIASFKDMGLAMATVQKPEINHNQVSTLFWINVFISIAIMLATVALAPWIARLYNEPRVVEITRYLAITILFSGFSIQHQALLQRQMHFGLLTSIQVASLILSFVAAIVGAWLGMGYWALVLLALVRELVAALGMWIACRWRPGAPVRRSGVRSMIAFGSHVAGSNILTYIAGNLDKVLVGRYFGADLAGLYGRAYQLLIFPIQQFNTPATSVAVPALSRLQNNTERFRSYYRQGLLLTLSVGMPVVAFFFVDADRTILALLGERWIGTVPLFRALGPAAFAKVLTVATSWVYISFGHTKRQLTWTMWEAAITIAAFFVGMRWGPVGVAMALSVTLVVLRPLAIAYCYRQTPLGSGDAISAIWRPAVASIFAGVILYALRQFAPWHPPVLVSLVTDFAIYIIFYILLWVGLPGGRASLHRVRQLAQDLKTNRSQ